MTKRLPPLNALHAFVVTARHLNLTRAAEELCVTQGAVSRQIATLEGFLGFPLFQRHARGLNLTERGSELLPEVEGAFDQLLRATQRATLENGTLTLKAPTCAMRWLVPQLLHLEQAHPELEVALTTTTGHGIDFKSEPFDAAVVFVADGQPPAGGIRLFDERIAPVLAPSLSERLGPLTDAHTLPNQTFLHPTRDRRDWLLWLSATGRGSVEMRKHQHFDTMDLAISAAIQGFGIAMADVLLVAEDVRMGRLVMPCDEPVATGAAYYLLLRPASSKQGLLETLTGWFTDAVPAR